MFHNKIEILRNKQTNKNQHRTSIKCEEKIFKPIVLHHWNYFVRQMEGGEEGRRKRGKERGKERRDR